MKSGNGKSFTRTDAQRAALRKAYKLLCTHFDHCLIVCSTSAEHHTAQGPDPDVCWAGGWLMADSLANFAKRRIEYRHSSKSEPRENTGTSPVENE